MSMAGICLARLRISAPPAQPTPHSGPGQRTGIVEIAKVSPAFGACRSPHVRAKPLASRRLARSSPDAFVFSSYSHRILLVFSWYSLGVSPLRSRRAFGGPVAPPPSRYLDLTAPVRPLSRWNAGSAPPTDGRVKIQPSRGSTALFVLGKDNASRATSPI